MNALETEFVAASRAATEESARREEEVRRRELEQTRALAEEQQRRADIEAAAAVALRKTNARLWRLAVVAIVMALLAVAGWWNAKRKQNTVTALIDGQGVVVESETLHPAAPPTPASTRPLVRREPVPAARSSESTSETARPHGVTTSVVPDARPEPTGGTTARPPIQNGTDLLDRIRIRASSGATGRVISGTELPANLFKIWIDGPPEALSRLQSVQYEFNHPTFRQKQMIGRDRASGFAVGYTGWGCLTSVMVTFTLRDRQAAPPPHRDFDMCAAIEPSPPSAKP